MSTFTCTYRRAALVALASVALATLADLSRAADLSEAASSLLFTAQDAADSYSADEYAADVYADDQSGADMAEESTTETPTVETFTERYANGNVKIERQVTLDADGNYVNHGKWKMNNTAGKVVAEGQFDMGRRVGVWSRWHDRDDSPVFTQAPFNRFQAPFLSQANFTDGVLDGEWIIYDAAQQKCSQISIRNGQRHGLAVVWTQGGKILRQSNYDQGVPVGDVLQLNPQSGEAARAATFVKGRQVVAKTTNFSNRGPKKTEAQFLAPKTVEVSPDDYWNVRFAQYENEGEHLRHGPSRTWHANGQLQMQGRYDYDKRVGQFTFWPLGCQ